MVTSSDTERLREGIERMEKTFWSRCLWRVLCIHLSAALFLAMLLVLLLVFDPQDSGKLTTTDWLMMLAISIPLWLRLGGLALICSLVEDGRLAWRYWQSLHEESLIWPEKLQPFLMVGLAGFLDWFMVYLSSDVPWLNRICMLPVGPFVVTLFYVVGAHEMRESTRKHALMFVLFLTCCSWLVASFFVFTIFGQ